MDIFGIYCVNGYLGLPIAKSIFDVTCYDAFIYKEGLPAEKR